MNPAFEKLNVNALYEVLAEILSDKHGAKITYKVEPKKEARAEQWQSAECLQRP